MKIWKYENVEIWKYAEYENELPNDYVAQRVLNEARKHIPTSIDIWIVAAKLEEAHQKFEMVGHY